VGRPSISKWFIYYTKIFLVFKFLSPFKFRYFSKILNLISMIHQGKFLYIVDLLSHAKMKLKSIKNFCIYCLIFVSLYKYVQRIYIRNSSTSFLEVCKRFLYLSVWRYFLGPFFNSISQFLSLLIKHFMNLNFTKIKFYLINILILVQDFQLNISLDAWNKGLA